MHTHARTRSLPALALSLCCLTSSAWAFSWCLIMFLTLANLFPHSRHCTPLFPSTHTHTHKVWFVLPFLTIVLSSRTADVSSPQTHRGGDASCVSSAPMTSQSWSCTAAASICTASHLEHVSAFGSETGAERRAEPPKAALTRVLPRVGDEGR